MQRSWQVKYIHIFLKRPLRSSVWSLATGVFSHRCTQRYFKFDRADGKHHVVPNQNFAFHSPNSQTSGFSFFYFEVLGAPLGKESKSPPLGGANNGRN